MRKWLIAGVVVLVMMALGVVAPPVGAMSDETRGRISQYCASIKQVLRVIQREDSRNRIAVGAEYETLMSHYLTPLNLRLVANNLGDPQLIALQTDFAEARGKFSSKFIEYSRSFEKLLASDCQREPEAFYEKLEGVRELRAEVQALAESLGKMARTGEERVSGMAEKMVGRTPDEAINGASEVAQ